MTNTHLFFQTEIGRQKPNSIRNKEQICPFCEREKLIDKLAVDGPIIFLKNKYPVLENTYQTVLIETDDCHGELSIYSEEHLLKLIRFGLTHWLQLVESGEYESVIFFKNHGPLSGGSIAHPHMQIIGLKDMNYQDKVRMEDFEGLVIHESDGSVFSISTKPRAGFYEFNVKLGKIEDIYAFSKYIQTAAHYTLNYFPFSCSSYNLFFYQLGDSIYAKIIPRFITTPLFIGYLIPQVPNNIEWIKNDVREKYFG